MQYFGSNNVERVGESWMEVKMRCVVDGAELRWMELGGGECTV